MLPAHKHTLETLLTERGQAGRARHSGRVGSRVRRTVDRPRTSEGRGAWRRRIERRHAARQAAARESAPTGPADRRCGARESGREGSRRRCRSRRPRLHQPASRGYREASSGPGRARRRRGLWPFHPRSRQARADRVRLGEPDRAAARRPRPSGRARRRALEPARDAGLRGASRVLLQRRRRADRQPRDLDASPRPRASSPATPAGRKPPTTANTSPTSRATTWRARPSRRRTARRSRARATSTISMRSASSPSPICATSRTWT